MEFAEAQRTTSLNAGHEAESSAPLDALARTTRDTRPSSVGTGSLDLGSLDGRERSLLFLRLGAGRSRREAARALGLSPAQESRLFRRALDKARAVAAALDGP